MAPPSLNELRIKGTCQGHLLPLKLKWDWNSVIQFGENRLSAKFSHAQLFCHVQHFVAKYCSWKRGEQNLYPVQFTMENYILIHGTWTWSPCQTLLDHQQSPCWLFSSNFLWPLKVLSDFYWSHDGIQHGWSDLGTFRVSIEGNAQQIQ